MAIHRSSFRPSRLLLPRLPTTDVLTTDAASALLGCKAGDPVTMFKSHEQNDCRRFQFWSASRSLRELTTSSRNDSSNPTRSSKSPSKSKTRRSGWILENETSALIDSATGVTTLLIHPNKAFLKISPEEIKQQTKALKEMLGQKLENPADVQLKPTGKKEKINGFDTEEYTTNFNGVEMSLSIAKQYPNYQKIVEALYQVQNGPAMEAFRSMSIPPDKYPGLPVRTTQTIMGQKIVMTLDSAQEIDVPDADFAIPADYKELNPPAGEKADHSTEKRSVEDSERDS